MSEQLRFGVIGIGDIVTTMMAPAIVAEPRAALVAAVSRDEGRARAFGSQFDLDFATTSYDEMLARSDVDAVFIATPNALHADQVIAAARAGKHVFCDKPMATSVADAEAVVRACDEAEVTLGLNFHYRHLVWVEELRRMIAGGTLGEIETIEADVGSGTRHYTNWRTDPAMAGIGSVYNVGVHLFDVLTVVLDAEPVEVSAMFDQTPDSGNVEMQALILMRFSNGTMVTVNCNERTKFPRNTVTVQGSKGRVIGENLTRSREAGILQHLGDDGQTSTTFPPPGAYLLCVTDFTEAVLDQRPPRATGHDGLRSMRLCDAILRSVVERRRVTVES